ncbi:MAG: hypothetical protein CMJ46_06575 [Planctomyces sp.]|nr:hypothetical protein [Planctomyces sp.]
MDAVIKTTADQNYFHRFPVLHLLRVPRMALDVRKLVLALVAVVLMHHGHDLIDAMFPASIQVPPVSSYAPVWKEGEKSAAPLAAGPLFVQSNTGSVFSPWDSIYQPAWAIASGGNSWNRLAYLWMHLAWSILIWGFLGLAVCRIAALEFVTDTRSSLRSAAGFGLRNGKAILVSSLIATFAGLFIWCVLSLFGLLEYVKPLGNGDSLATMLWFIPWLIALPLALLLIGALAGFPLTLATVSVEGTDGFDGFSRPFSYIFTKPFRYLGYWFLAVVLSLVAFYVFDQFIQLVERLAEGHVLPRTESTSLGMLTFEVSKPDRPFFTFWVESLEWLREAYRVAVFFTAGTVIYFLMRRANDAIALDEVYVPPANTEGTSPPLSGIAATSQTPPKHDAPIVPNDDVVSSAENAAPAESRDESASEDQNRNGDDDANPDNEK